MLFLGFASGLPLYLVYQKTSFWMREEGVALSTIGFFFWVGMFYSFKFVWAPIADKVKIPVLTEKVGQRRSWMMVAITGTVIALTLIALSNPGEGIGLILTGALLLSFSGATLDVSIDAWRIESAPTERQANMAASYSLGYRGALIFSNFGFVIAGWLNWPAAFATMAIAMATTGALVMLIKEPQHRAVQKDLHDLPFFAGPWNAIAVATGIFILSRVLKFFNLDHLTLDLLLLGGVGILVAGPYLFKGTTSSALLRLAIAGAGVAFVLIRDIALLAMQPVEDGPPTFSLLVIMLSIILVAAYSLLIRQAILQNNPSLSSENDAEPRGKIYVLYATPFLQVWERFGKIIIPIFIFVMIYRTSDFTMGVMAIPLYADLGYAKELVGVLQGGPGVISTMVGLFIGGAFANWLGVRPSLIIGGVLTLVTNGFYSFFAAHATGSDPTFLTIAICADNIAGGFVTTVFIAYLSSLVDPAYAATQYALFSSVFAMVNKFVAGFSGVMAEAVGYVWFFLITASYAIPGILMILLIMRIHPLEAKPPPAAANA